MIDSFEKIPVKIFATPQAGSKYVAGEIANLIKEKQRKGEDCILGLATGSTPISLYAELVRMHKEEGLSFRNVIIFNLDEYYPLQRRALQSYWGFMHRNLFNHIDIDPSNIHITNGELPKEEIKKYCWDGSEQSKEKFTSLIQNEMPQQTYLELGIWYQQLNCKEEALKVFSMAVPNTELVYWKAFLENKPVDISHIQPGINFPFRAETAAVLEELIKTNDQLVLKYHLALIEWNRNNLKKSIELFTECGTQPGDPSFYAARAALMKDNAALAVADLQKAVELDQQQWRYHKLLAEHFILQKLYEKALAILEPFYKSHADNYIIGMLYAKTLLLSQKYTTVDAFLMTLKILPFEGATEGRQLYHEAKLIQAVMEMKKKQYKKALQFIGDAKLWPQNLGVGKPYDEDIDERLEDWLNYLCYTSLNNNAAASQSLQKIIVFTPKVDNTVLNFLSANHLVSAWAIEKTSTAKKAEEWLEEQVRLYPANKIIQWSLQVYSKQQSDDLTADEKDVEVRILERLLQLYN